MKTRFKLIFAVLALLVAIVWLAVRLNSVPLGGPSTPSVRAEEPSGAEAATPISVEVSPGVMAELKPGEIAYKDKDGQTIILARPPASKARAREMNVPAETSVAPAMIQYLLHGPTVHGFTQEDAEWFLAIFREHEELDAKKIGLWGMGFALSNDPPDVPPRTFSLDTRLEMERVVFESLSSDEAVIRRSAAAQAFIGGLDQRPEFDARLKELTHDPDAEVAHWVTRRLERAATDRAK